MNNPKNSPGSIIMMHTEYNARQKTEWNILLQIAGVVKKKKLKLKKKFCLKLCVCVYVTMTANFLKTFEAATLIFNYIL